MSPDATPLLDSLDPTDPAQTSDAWLRAAMLGTAVTVLGHALQLGDGTLKSGTIPWLIASLAACLVAVLAPMPKLDRSTGMRLASAVLVACIAWQVFHLFQRPPFDEGEGGILRHLRFRAALSLTCALALVLQVALLAAARFAFPLVLAGYFFVGSLVIRASPSPFIDVFVFQRDACVALLNGTNPYTITFANIYGDDAPWYAPGVSIDGRLQFGYPYMPLTLLMTVPGHWFAGDFRYSHLAAVVGAAALIAYARPSRLSFAAASLLLLQPRGLYVLERGWSEPQNILLLAATVFASVRAARYVPMLLGLFVVSKQYLLAAAGAAPLLVRRWGGRHLTTRGSEAAVAALVATAPLALLAPVGFWRSVVALQFKQPYRPDSLSLPAWFGGGSWVPPVPWWLAFVLMFVTLALALWRCSRTPAGFASAVAAAYFVFFATGKQAFANYYYLVIGAACCAIGTFGVPAQELSPSEV